MSILGDIFEYSWKLTPENLQIKIFEKLKHMEGESSQNRNIKQMFRDIRDSGYTFDTIIDVGAYEGEWSQNIYHIFPDANYIMIEPLEEKEPILNNVDVPNKEIYTSVLADTSGKVVDFHKNNTGSSYYPENRQIEMDVTTRETKRIDDLLSNKVFSNALLKMDVQGAEIDILKGAANIIDDISMIYLECSLIEFNEGAPLCEEVINELRRLGYIPFDIGEMHHKGNQLIQIDLLFVSQDLELTNEWQEVFQRQES
jgi:FkbM family methyltransferase